MPTKRSLLEKEKAATDELISVKVNGDGQERVSEGANSNESTKSKEGGSPDSEKKEEAKAGASATNTPAKSIKTDGSIIETDPDYEPIPDSQMFDNLSSEYENSQEALISRAIGKKKGEDLDTKCFENCLISVVSSSARLLS